VKRLFLLRHAKASREEGRDQDRILAPRGREDAPRMGRFLKEEVYIPQLVLCSTAARTRQTLELLLPELGAKPMVQFLDELYLAESEDIAAIAKRAKDSVHTLMIVGHNPGIEESARELAGVPAERRARKHYETMAAKFPTGSLAVIDFEIERWSDIRQGLGELELFVRAKDLKGSGK
jgi:phosphohistidine phosphatase